MHVDRNSWGQDHWETFAYVASRVVESRGKLNPDKMRTDGLLHPREHFLRSEGYRNWKKYPTILKEGFELYGHDDWSCLEDLQHEGFVVAKEPEGNERIPRYTLSEEGWQLWFQLERHIAENISWSKTFEPNYQELNKASLSGRAT